MMILKAMSGIVMLPFRNLVSFRSTAAIALTTLVVVSMCMICKFAPVEMHLHYRIFVVACMALMAIICGMWSMMPWRTVAERHPSHRLPQFSYDATKKDFEPFAVGDKVTLRLNSYHGTVLKIQDNMDVTVKWDASGWTECLSVRLLAPVVLSHGDRVKLHGHSCLGTVQWHQGDRPNKVKVEWDNGAVGIHSARLLMPAWLR